MTNLLRPIVLSICLFSFYQANAQGCSDAGFCTIGNFNAQKDTLPNIRRQEIDLLYTYGTHGKNERYYTPQLNYRNIGKPGSFFELRLPPNTAKDKTTGISYTGSGKLAPLAGSPFLTSGSGVGNTLQILGPLDSDGEIKLSADGKFLLAVNSGSNTIAVFAIAANGSLSQVSGSPFPSNGQTPVSIDVSGNYVFVVNKSQDPLHATPLAPNYSTFTIDAAGKLTAVSKVETTAGTSPAQVYVSRDNKYVFGVDFLGFMLPTPVGTLRSFTIGTTGLLAPVAGTPYIAPFGGAAPDNGSLGLWEHPGGNVLYVGLPVQGKVAAYNINAATGALTFQTSVAAGKAACWIKTNKVGDKMYVLNSADNTVQVYNTATATAPSSIQTFSLKNPGPLYSANKFTTSEDFSLSLSTNEKVLYVVCQHTNTDFTIGNYNYLHSLQVATDGTLTEPTEPLQLPVANTIRPKGSLVLSRQ